MHYLEHSLRSRHWSSPILIERRKDGEPPKLLVVIMMGQKQLKHSVTNGSQIIIVARQTRNLPKCRTLSCGRNINSNIGKSDGIEPKRTYLIVKVQLSSAIILNKIELSTEKCEQRKAIAVTFPDFYSFFELSMGSGRCCSMSENSSDL